MSVQDKVQDRAEYRATVDETGAEFAAFTEQFRADVSSREAEVEETQAQFDDARRAVGAYAREFVADAGTKLDIAQFHAAVESFREATAAVAAEHEAYAEEFGADAAAIAESEKMAAAVESFLQECHAHRGTVGAYSEAFADDVAARRAAWEAERQSGLEETLAVFDSYREEFYGAEFDAPPVGETTTETGTRDEEPDTAADEWTTETETAEDVADAGDEPETEIEITDEEPAVEQADDEQAESLSAISSEQDDAETESEYEQRLSDVPYGTLKKAANAMDYEGDLNTATKDELIEFFADKDMAELEAALEE